MQNQPSHIQSDDASAVMNISFSSLLGEQNKLQFMVPSKQPLVHSDVVHHKAIMTSGPLHAEQQLAAALSHEAINDLVRLRPDYVSAGEVRSALKTVKAELNHGRPINKVLQTFKNAFEFFVIPLAPRSGEAESKKHAHEAGKDLAKLINGSIVKDLVELAPKHTSNTEMRSSIHELKNDLRTGQGILPWLNSVSHLGSHHPPGPIPLIYPIL